jgi:hypothetical protein
MAALFSYGLVLAISIIIGLIFTIIGVFVGHIILFDSIFLAAISGIICNQIWSVHPALCLLIAIALFGLLFWLQNTKVGFWIIGVLLSAFWAFVFGFFAHIFAGEDMIWFYVVMGLGFIVMMGLHLKARNN